MMAWTPKPLEGAADDAQRLAHLIEALAANAHDVWGKKRVGEGWTYGPARDAEKKTSPFLVPYEELPEIEKETDRAMARGTIAAALALGCVVEPGPRKVGVDELQAVEAWGALLKASFGDATGNAGSKRAWDFDLDDGPELASRELEAFPALRRALQAFQEALLPHWRKVDGEAARLQKRHRAVARWSIWPGISAVLLALIQLATHAISALSGNHSVQAICKYVGLSCFYLEVICAAVAATAVYVGHREQTRDRWLAARQAAERLRILKFRALADERLWSDPPAWKAGWEVKLEELGRLTPKAAKDWILQGSSVPEVPEPRSRDFESAEVSALAIYYRIKRHRFQGHYFQTKARQHRAELWDFRHRLPVWLFVGSIAMVLLHSGLEIWNLARGAHGGPWLIVALVLLALGAALPIGGFGIRAWFSAFEIPRRAHLFQSKAQTLEKSRKRLKDDQFHARRTFTHIVLGEDMLENEHREWCRLILEAEWFV